MSLLSWLRGEQNQTTVGEHLQRAYGIGTDPLDQSFNFGGYQYLGLPYELPARVERVEPNFAGVARGAHAGNGVVFAVERARLAVFSEARFQFRRMQSGRPGDLFGNTDLLPLEMPWTNGTTGDLLARMLLDADLAGNAYVASRPNGLKRMRPDWVNIVVGLPDDPSGGPSDLDSEILGYVYWPGGFKTDREPTFMLPDEVAHFAPMPDPEAAFKGMSWLTPILSEIEADQAATEHKRMFFRNGATMNNVVSFDASVPQEKVRAFSELMNSKHQGVANAYKTLYLGGGADVKTIGADLRQLDFKVTQGAGETRIAAAGGVPPIIVGLSEGLAASTYSNYGQARRHFADATLRPLWRNVSASLAPLVKVPEFAELWYDDRDIAFLRDDMTDAASIQQTKAATIQILVHSGYTPETAVAATEAQDFSLLKHTGLYSVQLQEPGSRNMPTEVGADVKIEPSTAEPTAVPATAMPMKMPATGGKP